MASKRHWDYKKFQNLIKEIFRANEMMKVRGTFSKSDLHKFCYYCDFDYYLANESSISYSEYIHLEEGPVPIHFDEAIDELLTDSVIKWTDDDRLTADNLGEPLNKGYMDNPKDKHSLSEDEKESVMTTLVRLRKVDLDNYYLKDVPWKLTNRGQAIDYQFVFYRNDEGDNDEE